MTTFLKLGGSLITDKTKTETVRTDVLSRLAQEIAAARQANPKMRLLLGHGSGSFGHVAAAKHGTRQGVRTPGQWRGFAEVSVTAARLNKIVVEALQEAGVPALTLQPSASVLCEDGRITQIATEPIQMALDAGLVPVVHGDVAFDRTLGGTIVSTEEVMVAVSERVSPQRLLLAGETEGVYGVDGRVIPTITGANFGTVRSALGGSRGTDVTGGMVSKVEGMLALVVAIPNLSISIFSGLEPGNLQQALSSPQNLIGTQIQS